ncbi:MAG TPA: YciI family protein [Phenylobacterium sp.]|nr:YciI family protein [Phenylobacterium sp.]
MALYVLVCNDKPNSLDLRMATREAHLAYVRGFVDKTRLGGPLLDENGDMAGSLLIMDMETLDEVRAFSAGDPYFKAGLFGQVQILPFRPSLGKLG